MLNFWNLLPKCYNQSSKQISTIRVKVKKKQTVKIHFLSNQITLSVKSIKPNLCTDEDEKFVILLKILKFDIQIPIKKFIRF